MWSGRTTVPSFTSDTGISVVLAKISLSSLECFKDQDTAPATKPCQLFLEAAAAVRKSFQPSCGGANYRTIGKRAGRLPAKRSILQRSANYFRDQSFISTETPADATPSRSFPIVGIGASAGGLEAFFRMLAAASRNNWHGFCAGAVS